MKQSCNFQLQLHKLDQKLYFIFVVTIAQDATLLKLTLNENIIVQDYAISTSLFVLILRERNKELFISKSDKFTLLYIVFCNPTFPSYLFSSHCNSHYVRNVGNRARPSMILCFRISLDIDQNLKPATHPNTVRYRLRFARNLFIDFTI